MKKNIKRVIAFVCIVAVVALLAAMPLLAKEDDQEDGPKASIFSSTVSTGSINTELIGGGTLVAEGTPEEVAACPSSYTGIFLRPKLGM